ncbi:hypothetical protein M431DRAFT_254313 [Trichoderma harzianum CBS 226.95]|uniref:Uncharacterized protein n=1 Tax=Trichoderma harzianum CBS 226.95 TaxID=983964 RepID=A0A2T4A091_TRIHA|nr:hypothetical protein M431DRAFT_254313 [Trichoderma harzianum CBS 226.95]PTB50485.1 hypothetical protein M431DRAFT_254313 [Trichoderma harzianum CBS 226.95]
MAQHQTPEMRRSDWCNASRLETNSQAFPADRSAPPLMAPARSTCQKTPQAPGGVPKAISVHVSSNLNLQSMGTRDGRFHSSSYMGGADARRQRPLQPAILVSLMSVPSCLEVEDAALVSGS